MGRERCALSGWQSVRIGHEATEKGAVSSGYIPAKDELNLDEILEALREAVPENPRLTEMPSE